MSDDVNLKSIRSAQQRILPYARRTPVMRVDPSTLGVDSSIGLALKLENMQITGSFKLRGALNKFLQLSEAEKSRGVIAASAGNHALAVAHVGRLMSIPVTIVLPANAPADRVERTSAMGAEVIQYGDVFDDAFEHAKMLEKSMGATFIHSFADADLISGQGTIGAELVEEVPEMDTVFVAIGGGGLLAGIAIAIKELRPTVKVIGVQPVGAAAVYESLRAGRPVTLPTIDTVATTIAPRNTDAMNLEIISDRVDDILLLDDHAMLEAAKWLWNECKVAAEYAGAASIVPLLSGQYVPRSGENIVSLICGAGTDGIEI